MQTSFSDLEYAAKKKVTRRDRFLGEIEALVPWTSLIEQIESFYPRGKGRGRPPIGLERMLRMYIAQQCFGFSDEGAGALKGSEPFYRTTLHKGFLLSSVMVVVNRPAFVGGSFI